MKIIITERQLKLIEQELSLSNDKPGDEIKPFVEFTDIGHGEWPTGSIYINGVSISNKDMLSSIKQSKPPTKISFKSVINPLNTLEIESNKLYITKNNNLYILKSDYPEYFLKKFSNNSKSKPKIESYVIRLALEKTFKDYWVSNDTEFSPGIRGIYKIGDYLNPKTSEDWSILNYFDTKIEVKDIIYNELVKRKLPLDDLVDSISILFEDKSFMNKLVNRQWQSILDGEIRERYFMNVIGKILNSTNSKTYLPGSKMDRYHSVDVTIDDINYQIKPLKNYEINKIVKKNDEGVLMETNEYVITTYGMKKEYLTKKLLHKIVFCNDNEILIFDNKNYTVPFHNLSIFEDKPEIYKIEK